MDNGELAIVPANVLDSDVMCIFPGAISVCVLRPDGDGNWILISGDCYLFTDDFQQIDDTSLFDSDDYIACHDNLEVFRVR